MGGRGRGRPKKRGKLAVSEVNSKLPKERKKKELQRKQVEQSNEEEHDTQRSVGRPPLISGHPLNQEESKERRKHLANVKREAEAEEQLRKEEEQEQEQQRNDLSDKRRAARQTQWENFRMKQEKNEEKKKLNKEAHRAVRTLEKWEQELLRLLPKALHSQLDLLALSISSFPESECGVTAEKAKLTLREGKSQFYVTLKSVKDFLQSCPFRDKLMFNWASQLSQIDYSDFQAHGLHFTSEQDVPVDAIIKEKVEEMRSEVFGNIRREDVRKLNTTLAIRVFKVGSFIMLNLSVLK